MALQARNGMAKGLRVFGQQAYQEGLSAASTAGRVAAPFLDCFALLWLFCTGCVAASNVFKWLAPLGRANFPGAGAVMAAAAAITRGAASLADAVGSSHSRGEVVSLASILWRYASSGFIRDLLALLVMLLSIREEVELMNWGDLMSAAIVVQVPFFYLLYKYHNFMQGVLEWMTVGCVAWHVFAAPALAALALWQLLLVLKVLKAAAGPARSPPTVAQGAHAPWWSPGRITENVYWLLREAAFFFSVAVACFAVVLCETPIALGWCGTQVLTLCLRRSIMRPAPRGGHRLPALLRFAELALYPLVITRNNAHALKEALLLAALGEGANVALVQEGLSGLYANLAARAAALHATVNAETERQDQLRAELPRAPGVPLLDTAPAPALANGVAQ